MNKIFRFLTACVCSFAALEACSGATTVQPLTITSGFNVNVVANAYPDATTSGTIDSNFIFYTSNFLTQDPSGFGGAFPTGASGATINGAATGYPYALASTSGSNALSLKAGASGGILNFTAVSKVQNLYVLGTGADGGGNVGYTLTFSNGTTQTGTISFPDWYDPSSASSGTTGVEIGGLGRVYPNGSYNPSSAPFAVYAVTIPVSTANQSLTLTSIQFSYGGAGEEAIFAVSASVTGYALTVTNGTGSGTYTSGTSVPVVANAASSGYQFSGWTGAGATYLANASQASTTLTMPAAATGITANYTATSGGTSISSPIAFSGGNANLVYDYSSGAYQGSTNSSAPVVGVDGNYALAAANSTYANSLPTNLQVSTTDGNSYQLGALSTKSGVRLQNGYATSVTVTATNPAAYSSVGFLATGGDGGGTVNYTLNFSSGVTQTGSFAVPDWVSGGATSNASPSYTLAGQLPNGTNSGYMVHLYDFTTAITQTGNLVSATFSYSGTGEIGLFGLSGKSTTATPTYGLSVTNGTGSGTYAAGTSVTVVANAPSSGYQFSGWTGAGATYLASTSQASTTLTMPAAATSIAANYTATSSGNSISSPIAFSGGNANLVYDYSSGAYQGSTNNTTAPVVGVDGNYALAAANSSYANSLPTNLQVSTADGNSYQLGALSSKSGARLQNGYATSVTLTATSPAVYSSVGFLATGGDGGGTVSYTLNFSGGATQTGLFTVPDWVGGGATSNSSASYVLAGQLPNGTNTGYIVHLYDFTTAITQAGNLTSVTFTYSGTGEIGLFGLSGKTSSGTTTYNLAVSNGTGSGTYAAGTSVSVVANAPSSGYQFSGWTGAGAAYLASTTQASTTLTMPAANTSITANYTSTSGQTYALTVTSGSGSGSYTSGTQVTVVANAPASGYQFSNWSGAGASYLANASQASTTLTMPAAATSITANYTVLPTYTLTVNNGTGGGTYTAGTAVTVTASPTGNQVFAGWTGATSALANPSASPTTLTMPASNTTITATFTTGGGGTYLPSTATAPTGVYSLSKLVSSYTGAAINVVRSDGTTKDIGFVGQNLDTATATSFAGSSALTIDIVYDQSGHGNNLTQTSQGNQPTLLMLPNTAPVMFAFNGYGDYFNIPSTLTANRQSFSSFVAARFENEESSANPIFGFGTPDSTNSGQLPTYDFGWFSALTQYFQEVFYASSSSSPTIGTMRTMPSVSPCTVGVVSSSTGLTFSRDSFSTTSSPLTSQVMSHGGWFLGPYLQYGFAYNDVFSWVFYPSALSTTDAAAVQSTLRSVHNTNSSTLTANIFLHGDSITYGAAASNGVTLARALSDSFADSSKMIRSFGHSGDTLDGINTAIWNPPGGTGQDLGSGPIEPSVPNILVVWLGTNDIAGNATNGKSEPLAQIQADYATYCGYAHSAGWRIVAVTALPRYDFTPSSGYELERQAFNAWLRSNPAGYFDAIWDADALTKGSGPLVGYGSAPNAPYTAADGIHPLSTGYQVMAPYLKAVINNLLAAVSTTGTTAIPANDFLDSIGVCTYITQGADSESSVVTCLSYAGIRNVRDDGSTNSSTLQNFINLHQSTGAMVCLLPADYTVADCLTQYETLETAGALLAVEGPNEPNNQPVTYNGQTSSSSTALPTAQFMSALYNGVKYDTKLWGIPVFASSEAGGSEPDNVGLQYLTIPSSSGVSAMPAGTFYGDYANTHNYTKANGLTALVNNTAWNAEDPTLSSSWDGLYVEYGVTWGGHYNGYTTTQLSSVPRVTTETGWYTQGTGAITQDQQGKLLLNTYLDAYKRGWAYTFVYYLHDTASQGYWGFFDTNYSAKLSGTYLHNLTTILSDNTNFAPGALNYSISSEPATVHDMLLQTSNGKFYLAVWDENASGSDTVTVNLGGTYSVNKYDPTVGTSATSLGNVSSVTLTLSDHVVLLQIP